MPDDKIQASVGMHKNGTTNCYNLPEDVAKIVKLLNFISDSEGGTGSAKLPPSPSPRQLFLALRNFQQTQNDLGRPPRLSVDGHVDPGANTLARLNQIARRIQPIGPGDLFLPPLREAIPGFDTVASDGTIIELPREFVRPGGRVVEYTHPDAVVTVRIETAQDGHKVYIVVIDNPTNEQPKGPLRPVPQAIAAGIAKEVLEQEAKQALRAAPGFLLKFGVARVAGGLISIIASIVNPTPTGRVVMWKAKREDKDIRYTVINP